MVEFEVKDVKITPDGNNFKVVVNSEFVKDMFGEIQDEIFLFPINQLENEDVWMKNIEKIMLDRAIAHEEECECAAKAGITNFATMTPMEKTMARVQRVQMMKEKHAGKKDLSNKLKQMKDIRELEKSKVPVINTKTKTTK